MEKRGGAFCLREPRSARIVQYKLDIRRALSSMVARLANSDGTR